MDEQLKMPLTAHLDELRWRLVKALIAVAIGGAISYLVIDILLDVLIAPLKSLDAENIQIIGTGIAEAFFTKLKVAVIAGLFVSSPVVLYQIWRFVEPGLYATEKRYVMPFVFFGTIFFFSGAYFCYRLVFPTAFAFFIGQYSSISIEPFIRISEYLSFSSRMLLAFGVVFELPVFTFFFARTGLVNHRQMISWWRYALIGIFVAAAVLTPGPDVASQMLMAAPLLLLYAVSIGVAYFFAKPPRPPET